MRAVAKQSREIFKSLNIVYWIQHNKSDYPRRFVIIVLIVMIFGSGILLISGFLIASAENDEIKNLIQQVKNMPLPPIEPIPEAIKVEPYQYTAENLRNPFEPFANSMALHPSVNSMENQNNVRIKEALEAFPLDALQMVGTLESDQIFGLVKDTQGLIHRVGVGNYMGFNDGKIEKITEDSMEVVERVPTLQGQYVNREYVLHLGSSQEIKRENIDGA